ncbi:uncharacterized protein F5147DRAFT_761299 [Suillus discolor]|uniref:Uncharacterized protein n=1 Tax=Suillus discolor TaxID=1912936 RepID=A0A9P7F5Q0_9AGAM|nr:uncharacterized protein F5147DRAFT_761299 [Suillus discolor]KAG2107478.1 hypothetical protein F5147DRAFT_761299 [Suillus discolor]
MTTLQVPQADVLLWSKITNVSPQYYYAALTSLWVAFILDSRCGLGTVFYLACSLSPFVFMLLNMLGIFILRTMAVWERDKRFVVFKIINIMAYLTPIFVFFFQKFIPSMDIEECLIPGGIEFANTKERSTVIVVYCLLVVGELGRYLELDLKYELKLTACLSMHTLSEILLQLWFVPKLFSDVYLLAKPPSFLSWHHPGLNLPSAFGDAHDCRVRLILLGESDSYSFGSRTQVVVLSLMVTRMHRDFWRSDRVSCGNDEVDLTLSTFMAATPDVVLSQDTSRHCPNNA